MNNEDTAAASIATEGGRPVSPLQVVTSIILSLLSLLSIIAVGLIGWFGSNLVNRFDVTLEKALTQIEAVRHNVQRLELQGAGMSKDIEQLRDEDAALNRRIDHGVLSVIGKLRVRVDRLENPSAH